MENAPIFPAEGIREDVISSAPKAPIINDALSIPGLCWYSPEKIASFHEAASWLYIFIPYFFFFFGWLKLWLAILFSLGLGAALVSVLRKKPVEGDSLFFAEIPTHKIKVIIILLLVFIWAGLSGIGGHGFQNYDYTVRNALFKDLITFSWPAQLEDGNPSTPNPMLVYSFALFLPAAAFGKLFGWYAANQFYFIWCLFGIYLGIIWFFRLAGHLRIRLILLFIFFSGLDLLGNLAVGQIMPKGTAHLEWWSGLMSYPAHTSMLYWAPPHTIAMWIITGMLMYRGLRRDTSQDLAFLTSGAILHSAFTFIGLLPFSILAAWESRAKKSLSFSNLFVAPLLVLIVLAFYLSRMESLPQGPIWKFYPLQESWILLFTFYFLEFGLYAFLCMDGSHEFWTPRMRRWWWVMLACLFAFPLYKIGTYNDFPMRGADPALFLLCVFIGWRIVEHANAKKSGRVRWLVLFLCIGACTAGTEITRSLVNYNDRPPALKSVLPCSKTNGPEIVAQFTGNEDSWFFKYLARRP